MPGRKNSVCSECQVLGYIGVSKVSTNFSQGLSQGLLFFRINLPISYCSKFCIQQKSKPALRTAVFLALQNNSKLKSVSTLGPCFTKAVVLLGSCKYF